RASHFSALSLIRAYPRYPRFLLFIRVIRPIRGCCDWLRLWPRQVLCVSKDRMVDCTFVPLLLAWHPWLFFSSPSCPSWFLHVVGARADFGVCLTRLCSFDIRNPS